MLISKKPRNVRYRRPSPDDREESKENALVSSSSGGGEMTKQKGSQSSSQSTVRPKPRPSQSGSTLEFHSEPSQVEKSLFRSNESDTGSDSEMQKGTAIDAFDEADDADTEEEEGEVPPIPSGSRKKRSNLTRQVLSSSTVEDDDDHESVGEKTAQKHRNAISSKVIEISSDDDAAAEENTLPARKKHIISHKARGKQQQKSSGKSALSRVILMNDEEGMLEWTQEDEEQWFEYFDKECYDSDFGVEKVIRWRRHPRKNFIQYRVKWKNFRDWSNSWEPGKNFGTRHCIDEFWRLQKKMYGIVRPKNTYKADDDRLRSSELELDSEDTDKEVHSKDSERRERALKRKVADIRVDRFKMREMKLYRQGKDFNLAKIRKRKHDKMSDEGSDQEDTVMTVDSESSTAIEKGQSLSQSRQTTTEGQSRTETPMEAIIVADDGDDREYVDSLEDEYMPLPNSRSTSAVNEVERASSRSTHPSRSSTGEASLQLASASFSRKCEEVI